MTLCNDARLIGYVNGNEVKYRCEGEPTEAALLALVEKLGVDRHVTILLFICLSNSSVLSLLQMPFQMLWLYSALIIGETSPSTSVEHDRNIWNGLWSKYKTLEFDRDRKSMSVICRSMGDEHMRLFVKGAPDTMLPRCKFISKWSIFTSHPLLSLIL